MNSPDFQRKTFIALLIAVSIAFVWILLPFYGAVFWGVVLAILFAPGYRRLLALMGGRANWAALTTLVLCLVVVILPLVMITLSMAQEGTVLYARVKSGQLNFGTYFQQIMTALPQWMVNILERLGFGNFAAMQAKLSTIAVQASQLIATQAISIGSNALDFVVSFGVMLYLLFFLVRDGATLSTRIRQAIPLTMDHKRLLMNKFTTVIRATVKGNIIVAASQGALGGLMFWFLGIQGSLLWGVLMAFLSLLPAIGAALIWGPVAIFFLFTGAIWQGVTLTLFGILVIGLVDNVLRPLLVGKDTQMPDYVVLISTLGGMALFGLNGFVIGPVVAALFIACWELFANSRERNRE
ncbi:MAG: AI-2E family transporter [Janthinobacterium lividum]